MSVPGFSLLNSLGSQPSDMPGVQTVENPLPACPDSPNCIRTTQKLNFPAEDLFAASLSVLHMMKPIEKRVFKEQYKVETVFRVFLFKDDMTIQLTEKNTSATYLHIRSASRVGHSDLGVNTRRVNKFLRKLKNKLQST